MPRPRLPRGSGSALLISARAVLLDVEGTVGPVAFVKDVLFPYAAARMSAFLATHAEDGDVAEHVRALHALHEDDAARGLAPPAWVGSPAAAAATYALWLSDQDRKATPLKALQGLIWQSGYAEGTLKAAIYDDVPGFFQRTCAAGRDIAIYSSGSVLAQRLYFGHTTAGDLTRYIREYFDTNVGPKTDSWSYRVIAARLGWAEREVFFVSDSPAEVAAARGAGMDARLCVREGETPRDGARVLRDLRAVDEGS